MYPIIYLLLGAGLGLIIGWLLRSARAGASDSRLEGELRQQLADRETELRQLRSSLAETSNGRAAAEAKQAAAEQLLAEQRRVHDQAVSEAKLVQDKALANLRDTFHALSADALKNSAPEFLRLANETFSKFQESAKGDLERRQESIHTLVKPLEEQLKIYQQRLQQSETTQAAALGEVREQLESLAQNSHSLALETQHFRIVLKSNQARGRWGEETLRRVVEAAGMSIHCDFSEQTQTGDTKPDLVVHLPGERVIIVDAKVPDLDFLNALDTADAAKRAELLANHAARLKATIKALADRDYPRQFPHALDHVVLFLPAESLFSAALEGDRELIVWAAGKKILLATPASLIALLRSVSVSWQQYAQTENAQKIAESAQELYRRVIKFFDHFKHIRAGLEEAATAFNDAVGSYDRMVRPSGERLLKLGGGLNGDLLPEYEPLETTLRLPPQS